MWSQTILYFFLWRSDFVLAISADPDDVTLCGISSGSSLFAKVSTHLGFYGLQRVKCKCSLSPQCCLTIYLWLINAYLSKQWRPRWNTALCNISSGLHCLLRHKWSSEKEIQYFFGKNNLWPRDIYNGLSKVYCIKPEALVHKGLLYMPRWGAALRRHYKWKIIKGKYYNIYPNPNPYPNPEIFVKRHICDVKNLRLWHDLPISVNDRVIAPSQGFCLHETSHLRSFVKTKPSRKFSNLQYTIMN